MSYALTGQFAGIYELLPSQCWSADGERVFFSSACENSKVNKQMQTIIKNIQVSSVCICLKYYTFKRCVWARLCSQWTGAQGKSHKCVGQMPLN